MKRKERMHDTSATVTLLFITCQHNLMSVDTLFVFIVNTFSPLLLMQCPESSVLQSCWDCVSSMLAQRAMARQSAGRNMACRKYVSCLNTVFSSFIRIKI